MSPLVRIITFSLIGYAVSFVLYLALNEKNKYQTTDRSRTIVYLPNSFFVVSIICSVGFVGFNFLSLLPFVTGASLLTYGFFSACSLGCALMAVICKTWRIEVFINQPYFIYHTFIGRTYRVEYADCLYYTVSANNMFLYTKNKRFSIDVFAVGYETFESQLRGHHVKKKIVKHKIDL